MRRRWLLGVAGIALAMAAWGTMRVVDSWRVKSILDQAKRRLDAGSPAAARRLLADAAARWPGEGEVEFLLGACEQALGRPDAAEAAWSRVPTESPFAGHAAMLHVRLLLKRDRFAAAEERLLVALRASGQHAIEARETLVLLLKLEGRFEELRALVQDGWDSYPDRFGLLRQLANLDSINPVPIEKIWPALEKAAGSSPDDDRIWLGRANLAIRTGEFARARRWLDDCLRRRPHDVPVWKSRLDLALATGDVTGRGRPSGISRPSASRPRRSSPYAPGSPRDPATRSGSGRRSRSCSSAAPGRIQAVERLAELETLAGRPESAARLRAEGRAGSGQDPLRDARDETQCGGRRSLRRDGSPGGGAGPIVRGPLPLVRGDGTLARPSGGPRGPIATGTSRSGPPRADARRPPRRARPGPSRGDSIARAPLGPAGLHRRRRGFRAPFPLRQRRDPRPADPGDHERGRRSARL